MFSFAAATPDVRRSFLKRPLCAVLTAMVWCSSPGSVLGDEFHYLPKDIGVLVSVDFSAFLKSKTYQELIKRLPAFKEFFEAGFQRQTGISFANIARITAVTPNVLMGPVPIGRENRSEEIFVLTVNKPVVAADLVKSDFTILRSGQCDVESYGGN